MNKIKTLVICTFIFLMFLFGMTFFEYIFLRLLGLRYHSIGDLLFFFIMFVLLEAPLSLITNAIPNALKFVGIIHSSKGWLSIILNTGLTFVMLELLDTFIVNIDIDWKGSFIFALISGFLNLILRKNDKEPPDIDSNEFKEIDYKFSSNK